MRLPWWHHPAVADPNPNGFYPEPQQPEPDIDLCHCHAPRCNAVRWTFCAEDAWQFIAHYVMHSGNITVTPARHVYRELVDQTLQEALHTIGPRT